MNPRAHALALAAGLAVAGAFVVLPARAGAQPVPAAASPAAKTIADPAERDALAAAEAIADPAARAKALDAFAQRYPTSTVVVDALVLAMLSYQQAGDAAGTERAADAAVAADPANVRALAISTVMKRARVTQAPSAPESRPLVATMRVLAERGLGALPLFRRPEGMPVADFDATRGQLGAIFNGAAGYGALLAGDYARARSAYKDALALDPANEQDRYQLGLAELSLVPIDPEGFWYLMRVAAAVHARGELETERTIAAYGQAKYQAFHGGLDGWPAIVAQAATGTAPPPGFAGSVPRGPTPAEVAVAAARDVDPARLSFSDWEFILHQRDASPLNRAAADRVWLAIQQVQKNGSARLRLTVKVLVRMPDGFMAALTDENQRTDITDLRVLLRNRNAIPALGSIVDVTGIITGYDADPFLFRLKDGEVQPAKPPAK